MKNKWIRLILLIMVPVLAFGVYTVLAKKELVESGNEIEYKKLLVTFKIDEVENNVEEALKLGETMFDFENKLDFGTIHSYEVRPHEELVTTYSGEVKRIKYPNKSDLLLTLKANGTDLNDSYIVAAKSLGIGKRLAVHGKHFGFYGIIVKIEEVIND